MYKILTVAGCAVFVLSSSAPARAWAIGSQINEPGCHEPITAQALRNVRATLPTAPLLVPTREERALIDDVLWSPPADFVGDLAGMTLLLGVRDNDLKGIDPLSSLDLVQVHGNPTTQEEHCIRAGSDDGATGDQTALAACRAFIHDRVAAALDGLDAAGMVDPTARAPFQVYVSIAGNVHPPLPVFYVQVAAAMHALEDSFTHTYRSADGTNVTVVLNWIDLVDGVGYDEARDGPSHRAQLDHCWHDDPLIQRNYMLAIKAATELLAAALDPSRDRAAKLAAVDAITTKWLTYVPGCTFANQWCDAPEAKVVDTNPIGCAAGGGATTWGALLLVAAVVLGRRRGAAVAVLLVGGLATARADAPPAAPTDPKAPSAPAVPVTTPTPADATKPTEAAQTEPGRDTKTPTVAEVASVRQDKQLGSALGFTASIGGSIDRPAAIGTIGARYRITERWLVGADLGWNPWITTSPLKERNGVATASLTLIRRFPMKFDRVNLRSSVHLGVSTLLFDVYGAPQYSTGPYFAIAPLGIDYDLGGSVRLVIDPLEFAMPVPLLGQLPLYYEQFRVMIGLQIGA